MAGKARKRPFGGEPRYAPEGVYGTFEGWARAAEAMADGFALPPGAAAGQHGAPRARPSRGGPGLRRPDPDLALLGLSAAPGDAEGFKRAFRQAAMKAHPDRGGSNEAMRAVIAAWGRVKARYGSALR